MKNFFLLTAVLILAGAQAKAQDWDKAVSLFNQKQFRPAIREFHAVLKATPEYYQAWYYIGASHFQLQGYEDTIDAFQNYTRAGEKDEKVQATASYFIGMSHYQLKRYDQSIPLLTRYISLAEKLQQKPDVSARAALGRAYIYTERFAEAIPVLTASTAEIKTDANNYYYIGYAHQKLGQTDRAITALNQGLGISPKDADMLQLLGSLYLGQIRQNPTAAKQAIATGERLLAVRDDERAWNLLGQAYLFDQQFAKAAPLLSRYAQAHTDSTAAWYNAGLAYSRASQWKMAAEALEKSAALAPANATALMELGYVYESDKQYDKALTAYERAYEASGRKDETARQSVERVKQYKP